MLEVIWNEVQHSATLFGIALVNTALASAAITALALYAMRVRGWNAGSRYCAWWLILALLIALPLAQIASRPADRSQEMPALSSVVRVPQPPHVEPYHLATGSCYLSRSFPQVSAAPVVNPGHRHLSFKPAAGTLLSFYGCVVALQFLRLAGGLLAGLRLKKRGAIATDPHLLAVFNRALALVNPRRPVQVAITASVTSPVMVGYLRPAILIPERLLRQLNGDELEQVLLHELAHAARYDDWAIAFQRVTQALFFFHPLIRFISWRIDANREIACDDRVIASVRPARYAASLTKIAELTGIGPQLAGALPLLSRKSNLAARVEVILDRTRSHMPGLSARRVACFFVFALVACAIGLRGPSLMAYPSSGSPLIQIPPTAVAPDPQPPAPPAPPPSNPEPKARRVAPKPPDNAISAVTVTSDDGSASTFDASGNAEHSTASALPPGTIVFRRDGRSYIIRDPSTLAGAEKLVHPLDQLARAQEQMSKAQKLLNEQMQKLVVPSLDLKAFKQFNELNSKAAEQLRSLDTKELEKAGEEQRQKMEALIGRMESQMAQQKLGEIQERLGSIQRLRGDLFEDGVEQNRALQDKLKELIERADKEGLAKPLQ